jgi:hypothetical protein
VDRSDGTQARAEVRGQFTGDPQVRQGVGTVGRDVHLQHVVHHAQVLGHLDARLGGRRQDQDPVSLFGQPHLDLAADHAGREHAADLAGIQGVPAGQARARRGPAHAIAGRWHVGRPAHHALLATAGAHAHDAQLVGVGVRPNVQHLGHENAHQVPALGLAALDLQALPGKRPDHGFEIASLPAARPVPATSSTRSS